MKRPWTIALLVLGLAAVAVVLVFVRLEGLLGPVPDLGPVRVTYELKGSSDTLYLHGIARGLTGDSQTWWLSPNGRDDVPDPDTDAVFPGMEPFFYELANDTLVVYTRRVAEIPPGFPDGIAVRQVVLSNPRMMRLYETADSLGLRQARFGEPGATRETGAGNP